MSLTNVNKQGEPALRQIDGVLLDLLMAVMNSLEVWAIAARDPERGLVWRDTTTRRMVGSSRYVSYERLVGEASVEVGLPSSSVRRLLEAWSRMEPWPDSVALRHLDRPYAFVTNCSRRLAHAAARGSGLDPQFVLSAEEAGVYKPDPEVYRTAARRLGSSPDRTLFVAGSPYDAGGAGAAGLEAVLIARRPVPPDLAGVPVVRSFDAIGRLLGSPMLDGQST